MVDQTHDLNLVQRIAAKDEELYAAYGQRLYNDALRLTADPALAGDTCFSPS